MTAWVLSSSVLILILVLLRRGLKGRIAPGLQYALWGLVLLRLLVPVQMFSSPISLEALLPRQEESSVSAAVPEGNKGGAALMPEKKDQSGAAVQPIVPPMSGNVEKQAGERLPALFWLWCGGAALTGAVLLGANLRFARRLRRSRRPISAPGCPLPVYLAKTISTPCLFGLIRPAVYVTPEAAEEEAQLRCVLAHELCHWRHLDGLWSLLRCACLILHWYNPLVWLAAWLSRQDGELACDAGAVRTLGEGQRQLYGQTLIQLTAGRRSPAALLCCATTMHTGKRSVKERIVMIAKKPKMLVSTALVLVLIIALAVGCTFSGKPAPSEGQEPPQNSGAPTESNVPGEKLYEVKGLSVAVPEPADLPENIPVDIGELVEVRQEEDEGLLLSFYYTPSLTEAEGSGWMFSLAYYDQAAFEQFLRYDNSGSDIFAKDANYYYAVHYPTDVRIFESEAEDGGFQNLEDCYQYTQALMGAVEQDLMARNGLTAYSVEEFYGREYTYDGAHMLVPYYPYFEIDGTKEDVDTLVLAQPAAQGEGGIWCVERIIYGDRIGDGSNANIQVYFPDTGMAAADYYAQQQAACDGGENPELLDPKQVALDFVRSYFDRPGTTLASFAFEG